MEFVTFEVAKKLKEKGFTLSKDETIGKFDSDEVFHSQLYCNYYETMDLDEIIAPTISQVLKWLREEKNISLESHIHCSLKWIYTIYVFGDGLFMDYTPYLDDIDVINDTIYILYDSYEEAALAGIKYVLDNLI